MSNSASLAPVITYADQINNQYNQTSSHFVSLSSRLAQHVTSPYHNAVILDIPNEWKRRNPAITKFSELLLCHARVTTLDRVFIDTTMQRPLNIVKVFKILNEWMDTKVMALNVYEDPSRPGDFIAWDGQHTAVALYILATYILKTPLNKCMVPMVKYAYRSKPQIRQMFIGLNGDDKTPLDDIDIFKQLIHTVRTDGDTQNETANIAELKQQHLENYGLFATASKYDDTNQPGAISRMTEIDNYEQDVILHFCKYFDKLTQVRPVDTKEIPIIAKYFDLCRIDGIGVTDQYIDDVAKVMLTHFRGELHNDSKYWMDAQYLYKKWHAVAFSGTGISPKFSATVANGMPLITAIMNKYLPHQTPTYVGKFTINSKDI